MYRRRGPIWLNLKKLYNLCYPKERSYKKSGRGLKTRKEQKLKKPKKTKKKLTKLLKNSKMLKI